MPVTDPILSVRDLTAAFRSDGRWREVVHGVAFDIGPRETVALVGESGSGKSVTAMSIMRLLARDASRVGGSVRFVAEGIFAPEVVAVCREEGLLAAAYCITQHPGVTFWRRITRDLREQRKPPLVLLRRGAALMRDQQRVVGHALRQGCRRATGDQAYAELTASP